MDRQEVWEHVTHTLIEHFTEGEFEEGEFEVHLNQAVGTITIIHRPTSGAMTLMDTTGSHYDYRDRLIMPEGSLYDRLHGHRKAET